MTSQYFNNDATALTRFNGTFTLALGTVSFVVQLFATSQALRRFGLAVTILALPLTLGFGLGADRAACRRSGRCSSPTPSIRRSGSRSTGRPTSCSICRSPPQERLSFKNAIDIIGTRVADAVGAVIYGILTVGFLMIPASASTCAAPRCSTWS